MLTYQIKYYAYATTITCNVLFIDSKFWQNDGIICGFRSIFLHCVTVLNKDNEMVFLRTWTDGYGHCGWLKTLGFA